MKVVKGHCLNMFLGFRGGDKLDSGLQRFLCDGSKAHFVDHQPFGFMIEEELFKPADQERFLIDGLQYYLPPEPIP